MNIKRQMHQNNYKVGVCSLSNFPNDYVSPVSLSVGYE